MMNLSMFGPPTPPSGRRGSGDIEEPPLRGGKKPDELLSRQTKSKLDEMLQMEDEEWLLFIEATLRSKN